MWSRGQSRRRRAESDRGRARSVCSIFLFVLLYPLTVQAQISDPFSAQGEWVSIDEFATQAAKKAEETAQTEKAVNEKKADEKANPAVPSRPVSYPMAPSRTATGSDPAQANSHGVELTEAPTWTSIDAYEREAQSQPKILGSGEDGFAIRYSTLPSSSVRSVPASRVATSRLDLEAKSLAARQKKEAGPEGKGNETKKDDFESKACKAYADYKRRQLAEMESDRKTLAQLKQALSDLGLTDRLNFMTQSGRVLAEPKGALAEPEKATP